jgi:hypothetical protein
MNNMKMNKIARFCMGVLLVALVFSLGSSSGFGQEPSAPNYVNVLKGYKIQGTIVLQAPGGVSAGNTAIGDGALLNTDGSATNLNTAVGFNSLANNTTGSNNTSIGFAAGNTTNLATTGSFNTFAGAGSGPSNLTTLSNATAIGACAQVAASNALVLGALAGGYCNAPSNTNVGIDVGNPSNILTVLQGGGPAIADGWDVYSSRRWKINIQPLQGALGKVERLRGVSYDLGKSGKHQIGVIAEEVGEVVPEVVSYEQNGKDARGVDYSRLTALLIEATKEQQQEIQELRSELLSTRAALQKVQAQVAAAQPALFAAK